MNTLYCFVWLVSIFAVAGCGKMQVVPSLPTCKSASFLSIEETPSFYDDLDREGLKDALAESMTYWQRQDGSRVVELCGSTFSANQIVDSLNLFRTVLQESIPADFEKKLTENFKICATNNHSDILVTGYYQPVLQASLEKREPFIYPLYSVPSDLTKRQTTGSGPKQQEIGRFVDGKLIPYWSREEIEQGELLKGQELAYLDDPVDAFFLHVQGSGLLELQDGTQRALLFADSNGRAYKSIGKLLANEGSIPLEKMSMAAIRQYLHEHLDEQQRILHYNERYIFFRWGDEGGDHGVVGSMGGRLTAGRSAAVDQNCFPYGIPAFLETRQPVLAGQKVEGWKPLRRFVFNQDSGAAIKGSGRLDLFFGRGPEAEAGAGIMKEAGRLYLLIKKEEND